jgi:signal transduction histidine kinase
MKAIGELAGGVAHDFNNNLTAILGSIQLLRMEEDLSGEVEEAMQMIENAARRSASLTRQLLAFGRKQFMEPETFSLCDLIDDMLPMLERVIPECIAIRTALPGGVQPAHMDRAQLQHVVMNLVVNAKDAMPAGGTLTIAVDSVTVDDNCCGDGPLQHGEYLEISVTDTGMGMDEETRSRVFEPFFTTKGEAEGTGLGLSTAYGIIRQSGGDIVVSSEEGVGTTFRIIIPPADRARESLPVMAGGSGDRQEKGAG